MQKLNIKLILILGLIAVTIVAANLYICKENEVLKRRKAQEALEIVISEAKSKIEESVHRQGQEKDLMIEELTKEKEFSDSLQKQIKEKDEQIQFALKKIDEEETESLITTAKSKVEQRRIVELERDLRAAEAELVLIKKENELLKQQIQ